MVVSLAIMVWLRGSKGAEALAPMSPGARGGRRAGRPRRMRFPARGAAWALPEPRPGGPEGLDSSGDTVSKHRWDA